MKSPRKSKPLQLLEHNYVWMQLADLDDRERVAPLLSYEQVWWQQGRYKKERRSRRVSMVSRKGYLYTGFLPYLQERFDVKISPGYTGWAGDTFTWRNGIDLRPYQKEAWREIAIKWRGQISLPTGTGKTVLAAAVLSSVPELKALFVVHTKDLLWQTKSEFGKFLGTEIGYIGDSGCELKRITIGMIQSLGDYEFTKHYFDIVMVDEVHHCPSPSYRNLLERMNCPIRLGFSGTPRKDKEGWLKSMGLIGPIIYTYSYEDAVKDGWLSQAIVRVLKPEVSLETAQKLDGSYRNVYNEGIIRNKERNELIVREALRFAARGLSCLVQVKETQHGEILDGMFNGGAEYVHGGTKVEQRIRAKNLLKGDGKVAIASPIFDEGVNIPALGSIIVAGGGQSETKSIQKIGRGLRKTEEKDTVEVVDFMDTVHKYLRKHSRERIKTYRSKGWIVKEAY